MKEASVSFLIELVSGGDAAFRVEARTLAPVCRVGAHPSSDLVLPRAQFPLVKQNHLDLVLNDVAVNFRAIGPAEGIAKSVALGSTHTLRIADYPFTVRVTKI